MFKKTLAIVLVVLMAAFAMVSCGSPAATESPAGSEAPAGSDAPASEAPASEAPAASGEASAPAGSADTQGKKIGVIFYSKDDSLGQAVYATLNYAAEALGVELQWKLGDLDPTAQITAAENMVAAGCDGILCIPLSEVVTQKVAKLCQDNGVYFAICFRTITEEAIRTEVEGYEYFLGGCVEDEVGAAENVVKLMTDAGRKNLSVAYVSPGSALKLRNTGFDQGIEKYGVTKLGEFTIADSPDLNATASTIQNFVNSYTDMDGILWASASVGQGETIVNNLATLAPDGKVQLACFDVFDGMKDAFANKTLAVAVGGMSPDALMSFMMLYNAVIGMRMSDEPVELLQNYIFVTDEASCEAYEKYIDNPEYMIYTADDIKAMSRANNPEFSIDDLKQIMADYTIENVKNKAEGGDAAASAAPAESAAASEAPSESAAA